MPKVFLSHSSKDKGYVEVIANRLGKENIIYDKFSFDEGNKSIDDILTGLGESDVFVFFVSDSSLESEWVKLELFNAREKLENDRLFTFYPILIDKLIKFSDHRIPDWIRDFSLRYISKPSKAAERIEQKLKIVSWKLYPQIKEREQLFIGRHDIKRDFHERIFNFDLPAPIAVVTSGFKSVGRRKFLLNSLRDANKIKDYYKPLTIYLHSRTSIEDFILAIYDLGLTDSLTRNELKDFLKITIDEKVELAKILLLEIFESDNKIFILDEYSIVNTDGTIVDWFKSLIVELREDVNSPFLFLISLSRVRYNQIAHNDYIYSINVNELEPNERKALLQALLDIDSIKLNVEDKNTVSEIFTGFPEQIKYAVDYIKHEGISSLLLNIKELVDFNSEHVSKSVQKYEDDEEIIDLLIILADYEFISLNFLDKIYDGLPVKLTNTIFEFSNNFIVEFFGASGEYIRLNDGIRDYVQRAGFTLNKELKASIIKHSELALKQYDNADDDLSEFVISIQEAFVNGINIPDNLLIPSHFLLAMRELYNQRRDYNQVIKLADRVLQHSKFLDEKIVREIKYWLCLALARKRDKRLLAEVQAIKGPDHNFLLGFYYRLTRQYEKALDRLETVVNDHPHFYRAKIELVIVYISIEDYDAAFQLAKENYLANKNNPFNIQYYLRSLLKKKDEIDSVKEEIKVLLNQLETSANEKALEMYYSSKAQYEAFYLHDMNEALKTINSGIARFRDNIYPYLVKLEIGRKFFNKAILQETISSIEKHFQEGDINNRLVFLVSKAVLLFIQGKEQDAQNFITQKISPYFPSNTVNKILLEIEKIKTGNNSIYK